MQLAAPAKARNPRSEQIILFRVSGQLFAVSSASVQEVRSADSLSTVAYEISAPGIRKVHHAVQRGDRRFFIVNGAMHFGLHAAEGTLIFVLRKTRTALLVDGIEKMATMSHLQALPLTFCHEERQWYRGLTALDQTIVPVVRPEGFLSEEELILLDAAAQAAQAEASEIQETEAPQ